MDILYLWRYSHPAGGRVVTLDHFTEAEALRIFREPERVEGSEVQAEREVHRGWGFASGLVRRADGAMVLPAAGSASANLDIDVQHRPVGCGQVEVLTGAPKADRLGSVTDAQQQQLALHGQHADAFDIEGRGASPSTSAQYVDARPMKSQTIRMAQA